MPDKASSRGLPWNHNATCMSHGRIPLPRVSSKEATLVPHELLEQLFVLGMLKLVASLPNARSFGICYLGPRRVVIHLLYDKSNQQSSKEVTLSTLSLLGSNLECSVPCAPQHSSRTTDRRYLDRSIFGIRQALVALCTRFHVH